MAELIKVKFPEIKLFAGGPLACMYEDMLIKEAPVFDALCYAEGEETITGLASFAEGERKLEEIPNIVYKENGNLKKTQLKRPDDLNNLAFPVYDEEVYPAMRGDQKIKLIVIDESRGCPFHCNFCTHSELSGTRWRIKSAQRITEEIKALINKYNIHAFRYAGSSTPVKVIEDVARSIIQENIDVVYSSFAHVRKNEEEDL